MNNETLMKTIHAYCNTERVTFTLNKNAGFGWSMGRAYEGTIAGEHWTLGEVADSDEYHDETTNRYSNRWEVDGEHSRLPNGDPIDSYEYWEQPEDALAWLCTWVEQA